MLTLYTFLFEFLGLLIFFWRKTPSLFELGLPTYIIFLFTITSHPNNQSPLSYINFQFKKFFHKFRPRNKPHIAAKTNFFHRVKTGKNYCERIGMMMFFFASYLLKKLKMVKFMNFPAFLLVGIVTMVYYYLFYYFNIHYNFNYWEFMGRSIWKK
jgi:hypothetical protein